MTWPLEGKRARLKVYVDSCFSYTFIGFLPKVSILLGRLRKVLRNMITFAPALRAKKENRAVAKKGGASRAVVLITIILQINYYVREDQAYDSTTERGILAVFLQYVAGARPISSLTSYQNRRLAPRVDRGCRASDGSLGQATPVSFG